MTDGFNPPLHVVQLIATRSGDPERGPAVWLRSDDARLRLVSDGELVWVHGPRGHELATAMIDDSLPRGTVVVRDIVGASPSEVIRLVKVNTDEPPPRQGHLA